MIGLIIILILILIGLIINLLVSLLNANNEDCPVCLYTFLSNIGLIILSAIILGYHFKDNVISRYSHLNQVIDFSQYEERCDSNGKVIEIVLADKTGKQYIFKSGDE